MPSSHPLHVDELRYCYTMAHGIEQLATVSSFGQPSEDQPIKPKAKRSVGSIDKKILCGYPMAAITDDNHSFSRNHTHTEVEIIFLRMPSAK